MTESQDAAWHSSCVIGDWDKDGTLRSLVFSHGGELFRVTPDDAFLRAFFRSREVKKYTHDVKPLHRKALALGCKVENVAMDTALAGYLLNPSASGYDVKRLAAEYGVSQTDFEEAELNAGAAMPGLCRALSWAIDENEQRELLQNIETVSYTHLLSCHRGGRQLGS